MLTCVPESVPLPVIVRSVLAVNDIDPVALTLPLPFTLKLLPAGARLEMETVDELPVALICPELLRETVEIDNEDELPLVEITPLLPSETSGAVTDRLPSLVRDPVTDNGPPAIVMCGVVAPTNCMVPAICACPEVSATLTVLLLNPPFDTATIAGTARADRLEA